jgi:Bacteriophage tail sheath protein
MLPSPVSNPGVYVSEISAFPNAVVPVATGVPAFIGHTQTAKALFAPVPIASLAAFETAFGGRCAKTAPLPDGMRLFGKAVALPYLLYDSMALFFQNGGGACWVISAGSFDDAVTLGAMRQALDAAAALRGPAMLVAPDAVRLTANDYSTFTQAMLAQAGEQQDRIAILDVPVGETTAPGEAKYGQHHADGVTAFRSAVSMQNLSYGAAYFPFLWLQLADGTGVQVPPSGAMAGIMAVNDATRGVWTAPADIGVAAVAGPSVTITDADQGALNIDPVAGKSIDAIRAFTGMGTMVWGARTLAGNSGDYRYVQARRTLIYIEQSVKNALAPFAFAPNDSRTWGAVVSLIHSFLMGIWQQGGLFGSSPASAFAVTCGPDTTTTDDIANGRMNVEILLALQHPAEFTVLTIQQQMQAGS